MRRPALLLTVFLAMAVMIPVAPAAAQDAAVDSPTVVSGDAATLASLVNQYRAQNGLSQLIIDPTFSANTQGYASYLMGNTPPLEPEPGYFNACPNASLIHASSSDIQASAPAGAVAWAENLAFYCDANFAGHAAELFNGLRNSPSHNATMLNPQWTHMGSAATRWGHSTIAVNRFAQIPGSSAPQGSGSNTTTQQPANAAAGTSQTENSAAVDPNASDGFSAPSVASAPEPTAAATAAPTAVPTAVPATVPELSAPSTAPAPTAVSAPAGAAETLADDAAATSALSSDSANTNTANTNTANTNTANADTSAESAASAPKAEAPALAFTGSNTLWLGFLGVLLIALGFSAAAVARRYQL